MVAGSVFATLSNVLEAVRREKSTAKVSQRAEVELVTVSGPAEFLDDLRRGESDVKDAGAIREIELIEAGEVVVTVVLATA